MDSRSFQQKKRTRNHAKCWNDRQAEKETTNNKRKLVICSKSKVFFERSNPGTMISEIVHMREKNYKS